MSKHIKLLLGGSPCTHWSIAQKNNRETEPSGLGWELFKNFLIAKEKFQPDYFLYENNKSAAQPIKDQISKELGVQLQYINSALVSAQNRQRFYCHNIPGVSQPADRGILLKDILESATSEKGYVFAVNDIDGKTHVIKAQYYKNGIANFITNSGFDATAVAEPICLNSKDTNGIQPSLGDRIYSKDGKAPTVTSGWITNVAEPIRIGTIESGERSLKSDSQANRVYSPYAKSVTILGQGGGAGAKTGLYACPINGIDGKARTIKAQYYKNSVANFLTNGGFGATAVAEQATVETTNTPVYQVKNGFITIKDKQYPIKLSDGYYIIRKLTVNECRRLQTIPDWYKMPCSASQNYKMLGNGWTIEVIKHILSYIPGIKDCTVEVLSMYDGMSCGQITLTELGCQVERYVSYEIDKYAIQTTQANFPQTEHRGDAFQLRNENWIY